MMFPIWINDGKNPEPKSPVYYVLAANGFFIHKETPFWKATVPVKEMSILQELQPKLELYLPPIPEEITREIAQFFAWVFRAHRTESMVLLWYSPETKTYSISAPAQKVTSGSISYDMPDRNPGEFLAGTFHSHAAFSAFHSCVDIKTRNPLKVFMGHLEVLAVLARRMNSL